MLFALALVTTVESVINEAKQPAAREANDVTTLLQLNIDQASPYDQLIREAREIALLLVLQETYSLSQVLIPIVTNATRTTLTMNPARLIFLGSACTVLT